MADWRRHTTLRGYAETDALITWFWDTVAQLSTADRALLLHFATGTSRLPPGGFGYLTVRARGSSWCLLFTVCGLGSGRRAAVHAGGRGEPRGSVHRVHVL